jgi:hypothetical protein
MLTLCSRKQLDRQLKVIWQVDKIPMLSETAYPKSESQSQILQSQPQTEGDGSPSPRRDDQPGMYDDGIPQERAENTKRRASTIEEPMDNHKRRRLSTQSNDRTDSLIIPLPAPPDFSPSEESFVSNATSDGLPIGDPDQYDDSLHEYESGRGSAVTPRSLLSVTLGRSLDGDVTTDISTGMPSETESIFQTHLVMDSLRLLPILQHIGLSWTTEEADRLITGLRCSNHIIPTETLRLLDAASGFFEAHPTNEALFPLFFLMSTMDRGHNTSFHRIISCVYSTTTTSDMRLLQDLLLRAISELDGCQSKVLDQFLFQVALIMLGKQQDIGDSCEERIGKAASIFQGTESFLQHKTRYPQLMQLDITSYSMVHLAFGFLGVGDSRQSINDAYSWGPLLQETLEQAVDHQLKILEDEFLHQTPGPFELVEESLQNPCLRNCLNWCKTQLRAAYRLPPTFEKLRRQTIHKDWVDNVSIYWYLWIEYHKLPDALDINCFGIENTEQIMGIPTAQLLFNMASAMMETSPPEKRLSRLMRKDSNVIQRAIAGAEVLERLTDREFARRFLTQLIDKDIPLYVPSDIRSSAVHLTAVDTFHAGTKDVFTNLQRPDLFPGEEIPRRQPSLSATLTSSLSSSTYSSMRRVAVGVSRHARARQRPSRSNSRTSALTVDNLSDTLSVLSFSAETSDQLRSAWLSRTSL